MLIDFLITGDGSAYSLLSEDQIWGTITKALDSVMYSINTAIYKIIIALYEIFEILSKARLLNSEEFMEIASRIGVVLGIVMLFNVIFNFINMLLDPNKLEDKEKGAVSIIKRCLLVIVMLGASSYFFDITWDFQNYIIEQGVLYKLMMPADKDLDTDKFGAVLAARTFTGFYHVEKKLINDGSVQDCVYYDGLLLKGIAENQDFSPGRYCLGAYTQKADEKGKMVDYFIMDYNFLMQTFVGGILVYLLVSYVIKVGVRVIQLTVLQIISPMAIISYLSPKKDNMFSKWWKIYFATYIDIFIRCAIIYLVVYLSSSLLDSLSKSLTDMNSTFNQSISADLAASTNPEKIIIYITIAMIIALLMFAKKAPDLLKELFPAGASKLGLGGVRFKDMLGGEKLKKLGTTGVKRLYGGATVGFNTIQRNARKNIGKTWDVFRDPSASIGDKGKWLARSTFGSLYSGLGGIRRGVMTTNKSGRTTATENAVNRTQSTQKLHDAGYGSSIFGLTTKQGRQAYGRQITDQVRGFFGKDQIIGDMIDASDASIQGLQNRIRLMEENYNGPTIQRSKVKNGMYTVTDSNGKQRINPTTGNVYFTQNEAQAIDNVGYNIAEMYGQLGKMKSNNKALTQKQNEQKSKDK